MAPFLSGYHNTIHKTSGTINSGSTGESLRKAQPGFVPSRKDNRATEKKISLEKNGEIGRKDDIAHVEKIFNNCDEPRNPL
jgi:hypothetical protein